MQKQSEFIEAYAVEAVGAGPARSQSAVSWAAIFAGATAAAALSLILIILGFGLGLSAVSPWSQSGASAEVIGVSTVIWLAVAQIIASGLGGYLTGRLRVRWTDADFDEVYFRDTAHGMLSWAIAMLATAAFLGASVTSILNSGAQAIGGVATAVPAVAATMQDSDGANDQGGVLPYFVDSLMRGTEPAEGVDDEALRRETTTIIATSMRAGQLSEADRSYLAQRVAQRTGLSQAEAEQRVVQIYDQANTAIRQAEINAKAAADAARSAAAKTALWMFVALLCGAFIASLAAIWGGRRRDTVQIRPSL